MEKQFVVLGLGIFGSTLVKTLSQFGREVIAIDKDSENVQRVSEFATKAVIGDVTDIQFLTDLGLDDIDVGIVAIGDRLEDSILATMNLKELGVPYVIVKAKNKRFKVVLERIGADYVVRPEKEMGEKIARTLLRKNIKDLIELDEENCIVEMNRTCSVPGTTHTDQPQEDSISAWRSSRFQARARWWKPRLLRTYRRYQRYCSIS